MVVVYGRGDFMAGPGDPIQAYDKDVKDVGRAIVAKTEDAQNPLPPGTRIENLNVDCDGKCFTKVGARHLASAFAFTASHIDLI